MAFKRIEIMDIRQIIQLKIQNFSNRKAAQILGIHRNTINDYVRLLKASESPYETLLKLSDKELSLLFPLKTTVDHQRYEELSSYFSYFQSELKRPGCTRQILWQEYLSKHPEGYGYTQFNEHFNSWLNRIKASGKFVHKAGDKIYVDYTGKKLSFIDQSSGEIISVEVFVGILPCSHYTFVEASLSQTTADFIGSMNRCLRYFEGVPKAIIPDNLKAAVTKSSKYEPILNKTFKALASHYGCVINPTRAYSPQDKALVEGAVKLVYQRIFYPLSKMQFFSLKELNSQISILLTAYNDCLMSQSGLSRKHQFLSIEKEYLASLPPQDYEIRYYKTAKVQKMGYVYLHVNKNYYSVPYRLIGKQVEISYNQDTVEIYHKQSRICSHKRSFRAGHYVTIREHLSSSHQFYGDWSPSYFEKLAKPLGESVLHYIQALIEQAKYPEVAYKQCLGIFALAKKYTHLRVNNACQRGLGFHRYGYHIIKNILANNMDLDAQALEPASKIPPHQNIRGAEYYQ